MVSISKLISIPLTFIDDFIGAIHYVQFPRKKNILWDNGLFLKKRFS